MIIKSSIYRDVSLLSKIENKVVLDSKIAIAYYLFSKIKKVINIVSKQSRRFL